VRGMEHEFNVGDRVTIVDEPYKGPPDLWVPLMDKFCFAETTITEKKWDSLDKTYYYEIAADGGGFIWCAGCFKQADESDFKVASDDEMFEMLGIKMR